MKEKIILASIKLLDDFGVKFTIDDIKNELKISKKTIYKYFTSKEELAKAVFDYIIYKSKKTQADILISANTLVDKIILCLLEYMEIYRLQSEKIFNVFSLNAKLLLEIKGKVDDNWYEILETYHFFVDRAEIKKIDDNIFRIIIEGIFKNIYYMNDRSKIGYECLKMIIEK